MCSTFSMLDQSFIYLFIYFKKSCQFTREISRLLVSGGISTSWITSCTYASVDKIVLVCNTVRSPSPGYVFFTSCCCPAPNRLLRQLLLSYTLFPGEHGFTAKVVLLVLFVSNGALSISAARGHLEHEVTSPFKSLTTVSHYYLIHISCPICTAFKFLCWLPIMAGCRFRPIGTFQTVSGVTSRRSDHGFPIVCNINFGSKVYRSQDTYDLHPESKKWWLTDSDVNIQ